MHSSNTCDMYMCRLRNINDSVLSSLKMKGIHLLFTNKHEVDVCNKQGSSDLNHLSSAQQNSQIQVHCYLQLKLLENNKGLTYSSTEETTSLGIMNKLKRTHEYYVGLLMLRVLYQLKNFCSGAMMSRPHL
jgi:hypothetical protein